MASRQPSDSNPKTPEDAFGIVLRRLRLRANWSQEELAHRSGYNRNYISLLECGRNSPSLKTIFNLADAFERRPSELLREMERKLRPRS